MGGKTPQLSKSAIENIFQLRADGNSFIDIADRYPCSDNFIRKVIERKRYANVEIDAGLVVAAQGVSRSKPKRRKTKPEEEPVIAVDKFTHLSELMAAQEALVSAYDACIDAGMSESFLYLAVEEVGMPFIKG